MIRASMATLEFGDIYSRDVETIHTQSMGTREVAEILSIRSGQNN